MTETARAGDEDATGESFVPSLGVVPAVVAMAAVLVPVRGGVEDPFVQLAGALAVVSVVAFLTRRHGVLAPASGAVLAAGSSLGVVLLTGYALNQGITGSTAVPGLDGTVSLLFLAFAAAGGSIGVAAADYGGVSARGLIERTLRFSTMAGVGFAGLIAMAIVSIVLAPLLGFDGVQGQLLQYLSTALGLGAVAAITMAFRGYDLSFLDLEVPSLRTVGWTVGGLVLLFGALIVISIAMTAVGVDTADHGTTQQVEQNPELLVVIVPGMLLVVGPFEELLYRNVIQKSLYETFSRYGAVVVTSVIFAGVHVSAYATAGPGQILASLAVLFGLSLVLGFIYERTENLVVPALVHGAYNAIQMLLLVV
ncbi:CPBP family intramembrane glutamic endopeptidase [Natronococcus occultus]|uniref:Putative metal-dependent membrane protease n=1 Tax=Natronococcus occultus SP4 TaxID=694430 RepID=L0JWG1_9EURY|nr:type II CAAX endopeptidase family protein [Natronococcus occultus]AGB36650.1 putative metal-dependent membrane protease [Natronococcus occultus SP4]